MANRKKGLFIQLEKWFNAHQAYLLLSFLGLFLAAVVISTAYYAKDFLPFPAAEPARDVVPLFHTTTIITGFVFFLTQILLFFFAFRYRRKPGRKARFLKNFLKLEVSWTIIPAITFLFFFIWGQILWDKIVAEPEGEELSLDVMGEQFSWRVRYPGRDHKLGQADFRFIDPINEMGIDFSDLHSRDDFVPVQMHVPKNQQVTLYIRTRDVIHSFFIPYFRVKMDAVPGMITRLHFTPKVTTAEMREKLNDPDFNYEVACAELCGRMHFAMKLILVVDEPEDFEAWYQQQESWLDRHPDYLNL